MASKQSPSVSSTAESVSKSEILAIDPQHNPFGFIDKAVERFKEKEKELVHSFSHSLHHYSLYHDIHHSHTTFLQKTKGALGKLWHSISPPKTSDSADDNITSSRDVPDAVGETVPREDIPAASAEQVPKKEGIKEVAHKDLEKLKKIVNDPEGMDQKLEQSEEEVIKGDVLITPVNVAKLEYCS